MKYYLFFFTFLILGSARLTAQNGITFSKLSWKEALAQAEAQDKLIFLDAYANWCAPCKQMVHQVFPDEEVGEFFNEHFINLQIDMEKGTGPGLALEYNVRAYPTLLFINGRGEMVHRVTGFQSAIDLLQSGHIAIDPERRFGTMKTRYQAGERGARFLYDYTHASYQAMDEDFNQAAADYMQTQSDWSTPKNREFIFTFIEDAYTDLFAYILDHREAFEEQFGRSAVLRKIHATIVNSAFQYEKEPDFDELKRLYYKAFPGVAAELYAQFRMNYFQYAGDMERFAETAAEYYDEFPSDDWVELNDIAWTFYTDVQDREMLKTALKWAKKSVRLHSAYSNNDTLAALYYRLGKKKKGIVAAEKAIRLGKENGEDYSGTEALLAELRKL